MFEFAKNGTLKKEIMEWVYIIAITVPIALLLYTYVFAFYNVRGTSMVPTLQGGERIYVNKLRYRFNKPQYGDIMIVKAVEGKDTWIKRIIGLPGDKIAIKNGVVYRNGKPLQEKYTNQDKNDPIRGDYACGLSPEIIVPPGTIYFLGDNRNHSGDSRIVGPVSFDRIVGRAEFVLFPFKNFGPLK